MAVDGAGNVYVTGGSTGTNTIYPYDFATVKYDRDGNQVWLKRYDSGGHDAGYGIALDSETNVIVTGESSTIKYDRDGNRLWLTPGSGHKVVIDPDDNVFVSDLVRDSSGNGNGPLHLWMLSKTNGQVLSYETLGNTVLLNLVADRQGNVFVIGTSYSGGWNGGWNFVVHRRGAGGSNEWNDSYPGLGYAGTVDKRGNVYVTGSQGPGTCRIVKWTTDGQRAWVLDPPGFSTGLGVTVDNEFNISVANDLGGVINYEQKHRLHTLGFQPNGNFRLTLTGEPRVPVWLRASTNLWDWQNLSTLRFSVATADYTDSEAGSLPHRFYHTESVTPPAP